MAPTVKQLFDFHFSMVKQISTVSYWTESRMCLDAMEKHVYSGKAYAVVLGLDNAKR